MALTALKTPVDESRSTVRDHVADAFRQAAHISEEASALTSQVAEALDDGVHAARRAIKVAKRRVEELGDFRDETIHRVRRQPLQALGCAFGVGLGVGLIIALGLTASRSGRRE